VKDEYLIISKLYYNIHCNEKDESKLDSKCVEIQHKLALESNDSIRSERTRELASQALALIT